jgi:hypothetical protein
MGQTPERSSAVQGLSASVTDPRDTRDRAGVIHDGNSLARLLVWLQNCHERRPGRENAVGRADAVTH